MSEQDWEDLLLENFQDFDPALLQHLQEAGIASIGGLLGATQGLLVEIVFADVEQAAVGELFSKLVEILPAELLQRFQENAPDIPPPGVVDEPVPENPITEHSVPDSEDSHELPSPGITPVLREESDHEQPNP